MAAGPTDLTEGVMRFQDRKGGLTILDVPKMDYSGGGFGLAHSPRAVSGLYDAGRLGASTGRYGGDW